MQSISLVPSTAYNTSIYVAERKNCSGGSIVLEDRITDYFLPISGTTAVSVDTSLLHPVPNSSIQFTLIVNSIGSNVLNLSGFEVEQIQVLDGISVFTVQKGLGEAVWSIQMTSSDVRPERLLKCYLNPFVPPYEGGVFNIFNIVLAESYNDSIGYLMNDTYIGQVAPRTYAKTSDASSAYICAKFPMPVWVKTISLGVTSTVGGSDTYPNNVEVYGSNDGLYWTQILNSELINTASAVNICNCSTDNYYTFLKFQYSYPSGYSSYCLPSIAMSGFTSELINTGSYSIATPYCTTLPLNGYDIESNSTSMSSTDGSLLSLCQFGSSTYSMNRGSTDTPWEYIYTFSEAIRTIGMIYKPGEGNSWSYSCIKLFTLSYSDDKSTWTEYCRVDGMLDCWNSQLLNGQIGTYFYDSAGEHKYYKISVYSKEPSSSTTIKFKGLGFLQFQKGLYLTFESFVPKLSSNTQGGYILVASNSSQGDAYRMFDHDLTNYGGGDIADGQWSLLIQLPQSTIVRGLELVAPYDGYNRMPYEFSFQGSTDNDTWTNIKTFTLGSNYWTSANQLGQWDLDNDTGYRYYRIVATASGQGSTIRIGEIGLSSYASFKGIDYYEENYLVPVMSGESQDGYIVTAKSNWGSHYPWKAFDRTTANSDDAWECGDADKSDASGNCDVWIQVQLPTAKIANELYLKERSGKATRDPRDFTLAGSNDGETWTTLLTQTDQEYTEKAWEFENSTAYLYYRLNITKENANNDNVCIGILNLLHKIHHENN